MASAYLCRGVWYVSFRAPDQKGTQRTRKRAPDAAQTKPRANALARQLDNASRVVEDPAASDDVGLPLAAAEAILRPWGLLPAERKEIVRRAPATAADVTLFDAALMHPTALNERHRNPKDRRRHERELEEFAEWAGTDKLQALTLDVVQRYVAKMREDGISPDSRRHRLLYIRCAARMAPQFGLLDRLAGFRLDGRRFDAPRDVRAFTLDHLRTVLAPGLLAPRNRAAVALMAFAGLRPSEACRVRVRDLCGDLLHVGGNDVSRVTVKNEPSRRVLPLAAALVEMLAPLAAGRDPDDTLIRSGHLAHKGEPLLPTALNHILAPKLKRLTGDDALSLKHLRKTFRTLATEEWGLDHHIVEIYIGHQAPGVSGVSWNHYLVREASRLRPVAEAANKCLRGLVSCETVQQAAQPEPDQGSAVA
jgi:integrase